MRGLFVYCVLFIKLCSAKFAMWDFVTLSPESGELIKLILASLHWIRWLSILGAKIVSPEKSVYTSDGNSKAN